MHHDSASARPAGIGHTSRLRSRIGVGVLTLLLFAAAAPTAFALTYDPLVWIDPFTEGGPTDGNTFLPRDGAVSFGPYTSVLGGFRTVGDRVASETYNGVTWAVQAGTPEGTATFHVGANQIATAYMRWDAAGAGLAPGSIAPIGAEGLALRSASVFSPSFEPDTLYITLTDASGQIASVGYTLAGFGLPGPGGGGSDPVVYPYADFLAANPLLSIPTVTSVEVSLTGNTLYSDNWVDGSIGGLFVYGTNIGTSGGGSGATAPVPEPTTLAAWLLAGLLAAAVRHGEGWL